MGFPTEKAEGGYTVKSVLISIKPKYCKMIASGEKTLEIRKSKPKISTPFKCYIYCTAGYGRNTFNVPVSAEQIARHYAETGSMVCLNSPVGNGKVIGEFVCDRVYQYTTGNLTDGMDITTWDVTRMSCLTYEDIRSYENSAEPKENCLYMVGLYCWHISNLKIYEQPKKVSEFVGIKQMRDGFELRVLERPPQSWCYVEEV